jgi:hypothetical protein
VNHPSINGKDGVAGSIPAGERHTKPAGQAGSSTRSVARPQRAALSHNERFCDNYVEPLFGGVAMGETGGALPVSSHLASALA